jgi:hypothetical protein
VRKVNPTPIERRWETERSQDGESEVSHERAEGRDARSERP